MATGVLSYKESDGLALNVSLLYTVVALQVAVVDGWLGVAMEDGESGEIIALDISQIERQFTIPSGLDPAVGAIVYVEIADLTGHTPDDSAYSTSAGSGKVAFYKATAAKDANHVQTGIVLPNLAS